LKAVIVQQKKKIQERIDYVHPMIVEDLRGQIARLNERIDFINEKTQHAT